MLNDAQNEIELSAGVEDTDGIKERTSFRFERRVTAFSCHAGSGNGFLATIGSVVPFYRPVRHSIGHYKQLYRHRADTETTNLAVVARGRDIAEALLATAICLVEVIPAVVIYSLQA